MGRGREDKAAREQRDKATRGREDKVSSDETARSEKFGPIF